MFEEAGIPVQHIVFDKPERIRNVALLRLKPLPVPWATSSEELAANPLDEALRAYTEAREREAQAAKEAAEAEKAAAEAAAKEAAAAEAAAAGGEGEGAAAEAETAAAAPAEEAEAKAEPAEEGNPAEEGKPAAEADGEKAADASAESAAAGATGTPTKAIATTNHPPPPSVHVDDGRADGDVIKAARYAAMRLNSLPHPLVLGGERLTIDAPSLQCTLYLGNVVRDDDAALRAELAAHGDIVRCFIMRGAGGTSKVGKGAGTG